MPESWAVKRRGRCSQAVASSSTSWHLGSKIQPRTVRSEAKEDDANKRDLCSRDVKRADDEVPLTTSTGRGTGDIGSTIWRAITQNRRLNGAGCSGEDEMIVGRQAGQFMVHFFVVLSPLSMFSACASTGYAP